MTYQEIKTNHQNKVNQLITDYQVFFAFSNEQLEEGKAKINITDNKELTSIGMGGFMPKAKADDFFKAMSQADDDYKEELRQAKEEKEKAILYELNNYECFYAGNNLDEVASVFDGVYTKEDIIAVYKKFVNKPHRPEDRLKTNPHDVVGLGND